MAAVQSRIGGIFGLFFLLLVLAAGRSLYLGVLHGASLRQVASNQQLTSETVTAQRGTISDRNGVDLAVSEPAQDISADPYLLKDPLGVSQRLAPLLGATPASVLQKLSERRGFVYLARALPAKAAQQVLALKIPGVAGAQVMRRVYPRGTLAAQVLGMVGTEGKGLAGLEYSRDGLLRGQSGRREVVSDAIGQPVSITEVHPEVPGPSLSLTLDANIQQRTEDVLGAVGTVFNPKYATAIVMDPATGAVLAMANWPQVNANEPGAAPAAAIENRAVGFAYEPGSTFKAFTVSGALQQGLVSASSPFNVPDLIHVADRTIHDDTEHAEETLTTSQILARSSNVGAIKIGMLEGASGFNRWVHAFGFGAPTGIELPGEEMGVAVPLDRYSGSSMGNLPIGQGELVTPIQMAAAYSAIANGGILRPPYIVSSVGGRPRLHGAGHRVISAATSAALRQMLEGVLAPAVRRARSRYPATSWLARPGRPTRSITRPANTPRPPSWPLSSASHRRLIRSCSAPSWSTNRRPDRSTEAGSPRLPSGRS